MNATQTAQASQMLALEALEVVLAWARAERESDRRANELYEAKRVATQEGPWTEVAKAIIKKAEDALHDSCVREDAAEEKLKDFARAMLEAGENAPAPAPESVHGI